jgi:hypothetical protein
MAEATTDAKIEAALNAHLNAWPERELPVAWANVTFNPSGNYLRPTFLPARTAPATIGVGGDDRHLGIYQIDVFWKENEGAILPADKAGAVADRFKPGTVLTRGGVTIRILETPWPSPGTQEDGRYHSTVNVAYQADTTRT